MDPADVYKRNAAECFKLANGAIDPANKAVLVKIGYGWLLLADQATRDSLAAVMHDLQPDRPLVV
jgi:hypothetical protein